MLLRSGHHEIELVAGSGGVFEIEVEGQLKFSKKALGRFPNDEEIHALLADS